MKKIFLYIMAVMLVPGLVSCGKLFDSMGDPSKLTDEDMTASQAGMERLLADVYSAIPMDAFNCSDQSTTLATYSKGCDYAIPGKGFWDWQSIRSINRFIQLVDVALEKGSINQATRDAMLGEAIFARAYCYFAMVKRYGGVPIITEPLDKYYDGDKNEGLYVQRSTEKKTWDFVISELDRAAGLLPEERVDGKYRATKWAALGLQSRVALYAASVSKYWSKVKIPDDHKAVAEKLAYMESSYSDAYYAKCIEACDKIMKSERFSLYGGASTSVSKAKENLTNLFLERQDCEFIFGKSYKDGSAEANNGFDLLNSPNQKHAAVSGAGWGNYSVTSDMVDLFDNYNSSGGRADGTVRTRNDGKEGVYFAKVATSASTFDKNASFIKYSYPQDPFLNKDARFQAWVLYPGASFRGITILAQGGIWLSGKNPEFYANNAYTVGGIVYYGLGSGDENQMSAFCQIGSPGTTNHAYYWNTCFGIRKFLDPENALQYSSNPWYDIRYAEILLNYAEAYAESGKGIAATAKKALNDIRHRAAFTDDIEPTLENVLHERRVEFAFEGHEGATLHRRRTYLELDYYASSGNRHRKHTLLPVLDLRDGTPKYIFPRVNVYHGDEQFSSFGLGVGMLEYYAAIPSAEFNALVKNPIQE